jgi:hypothetical protein
VEIQTPWQHPNGLSSFHLYPIQVTATSGISQQALYKALTEAGVKVNLHYIPVYLQPYYARLGFKRGYCPHAEDYFKSSMSIPVYASMTESQQHRVVDLIQSFCHAKVLKRVVLPCESGAKSESKGNAKNNQKLSAPFAEPLRHGRRRDRSRCGKSGGSQCRGGRGGSSRRTPS